MSGAKGTLIVATEKGEIELNVVVHREDDTYWAEVPSHPGLFASGESMDELVEAVGEAWVLYNHDESAAGAGAAPRPAAKTQSMQILVTS
jgi:predicted RNase H-like HicB family nuclease